MIFFSCESSLIYRSGEKNNATPVKAVRKKGGDEAERWQGQSRKDVGRGREERRWLVVSGFSRRGKSQLSSSGSGAPTQL